MDDFERPFEAERRAILREALRLAAFDGFTAGMMAKAAKEAGVDTPGLAAAFRGGPLELVEYWSGRLDAAVAARLGEPETAGLKIREKVERGVLARLEAIGKDKEAARRAAAFLALPPHAPTGARLIWGAADTIWRALGDPSTDFNFYSKRAILSGVISSTMARWFADASAGDADTRAFLRARIENVMQFEKLKAKGREIGFDPEGMFGWLARMRYPEKP